MDARNGMQFLIALFCFPESKMDLEDLEEAIRIASTKSPSGSFDAAQRYYIMRHGSSVHAGYLAFAKGTRWLAMVRRDEGQQAFEAATEELRAQARQLRR